MNDQLELYLSIFNQLDFEKITDHPNILIAANFWDQERFLAAKTCYKFMRQIDDLIDNYKAVNVEIAESEKEHFEAEVMHWIHSLQDGGHTSSETDQLIDTFNRFKIPRWTMETFAKSMIYDIYHDGFATLETFMNYSGGASIAPASVFVHLCGLKKQGSEFDLPDFDVREAAIPCAVFSYLVHIIRDFQKDQQNNLNYFADELINAHGLNRAQLKSISQGGPIPHGFRALIRTYYELADEYRLKTCSMIQRIKPLVMPRYQLSLEIIFDLYLMVFERINPDSGTFTSQELNPTPSEIRKRVYNTILAFSEATVNEYESPMGH